jgi:hypothetical protein
MNIASFTDELLRVGAKTLTKIAEGPMDNILARAAGWGAAGGAGMYAGQKALAAAGAAEDPAFTGRTLLGDTAKSALGALLAAGVIKTLARRA